MACSCLDVGMFWDIIKTAQAAAGPGKPFHKSLTNHLALIEQDILEYQLVCYRPLIRT
jgi:hypothetical protein